MKISDLGNLTSTFLLLMSFFCVQSAPARPLNERSTELAWVILDEQQSDSSPRRKITPKSIFISPSFGTQSCSSGYTLDATGRCVKVVKIDTNAHEQFVLDLLNQNYGNLNFEEYDDEEEGLDEALPTPGPFQFNIPLGADVEKDKISIIVAPTNGNFEDAMKNEDTMKVENVQNPLDAPLIITKISIKNDPSVPTSSKKIHEADHQATTSLVLTTTAKTFIRETRPEDSELDTSTIPTTVNDDLTTITTEPSDTTTITDQGQEELLPEPHEPQAIFFKVPEAVGLVEANTNSDSADSKPLPTATQRSPIRFPDRPAFDEALLKDFLQGMEKQVKRRFVTKSSAANNEEALYSNHRNRDRWLFPRLIKDQRHHRR